VSWADATGTVGAAYVDTVGAATEGIMLYPTGEEAYVVTCGAEAAVG